MSLYRPIPQLQLAANVQQPLSPLSLRDYGKLLYWIFFFPQAVRDYLAAPGTLVATTANGATDAAAAEQQAQSSRQRQRTVVLMSTILLLVLSGLGAGATFWGQIQGVNLDYSAVLKSSLVATPFGLLLAGIVFLLAYWQKQTAKGIVLGVATGVTTTLLSMFTLGELFDSRFLDMVNALGYGFIGGSGVGIIGNLAATLGGNAQPSVKRSVGGAGIAGLIIFLLNSTNYRELIFNPDFSQENLLAALSGALAFYGGAHLGQRRPLDWLLGKLYLNFQLRNIPVTSETKPYTKGTSIFTHYAPALEALFAPINAAPSSVWLPHVTLYQIRQLPLHLQTWLEHDWEAGLANAVQLWRYTNQHPLVTDGVHQLIEEETDDAKQVEKVAQFVNKVSKDDWTLILYPPPRQSLIARRAFRAKGATGTANLSPQRVRVQTQRQQLQRQLLRLALVPQPAAQPRAFTLETTAQRAIAGFWHLNDAFIDESTHAFQQLPDNALSKELQGLTQSIQKLLNTKNMVTSPTVELPERPKEPKRKATWDALDKFKPVIRYGWLYHQCKSEERREAVTGVAIHQLDEIVKDAKKIPQAERSMIVTLTERWRQEFQLWATATRSPQPMKPANPFIFLEPLRGRPPFVGRDGELKALKQAGSRGSLQPVLLSGLIHSGKSSLVHKASFEYKDDIVFVIFNLPDHDTLSPTHVYEAMYKSLQRRLQLKLTEKEQLAFKEDPAATTEKLVRDICYRFKATLVLVVGNIDQLSAPSSKPILKGMTIGGVSTIAENLFDFWSKLSASIGNLSFVFVSHALELPNTPFTSTLKKIRLGHLTEKEVLKLLMTPTPEFIPLFAPEAVAYIHKLTDGQPYLVQLLAHCVVTRFNQTLDKDDKLEPVFLIEDVDAVLNTEPFRQFSQPYFANLRGQVEYLQPGSNLVVGVIAQHADGMSAAALEQRLSSRYAWAEIEPVLNYLQTEQLLKLAEGQWQVAGELLRREFL